jgi:hypothetical protein
MGGGLQKQGINKQATSKASTSKQATHHHTSLSLHHEGGHFCWLSWATAIISRSTRTQKFLLLTIVV